MNDNKYVYLSILGIVVAESVMFFNNIYYGLGIHIINLLAIIFMIIISHSLKIKYVLQSLTLIILLRIINLSMPQFFANSLLQYSLIYGIMFIPIYMIIKSQKISSEELYLNFDKLYIYLPIGILIGSVMAIIEYNILHPASLIEKIRFSDIILIGIVMFIFVGTVEEFIFRGILLTRLENVFGFKYGILLSGTIFGMMHLSYGIINEAIFAVIFGIIIGYMFRKTKSFPLIVTSHGTLNLMLFGILPLLT